MGTKAMARKKPRTREEYHTAWLRIGPFFQGQLITHIGVDDVDAFFDHLTKNHSPKVRHRSIAKLRAILADAVLRRVIATNPALAIDGSPLLRRDRPYKGRKTLEPWRSGTDWSKDFRAVREHAFGKEEKRQARDIRRSVNLEAALGDAEPGDRAALLVNGLGRDTKLDAVYTPPTLAAATKAYAARFEGCKIMDQMRPENRLEKND